MNCSCFDFLQLVRFLPDIDDLTHANVSSLEQANSLFSAWLSVHVGALGSRMKRIFTHHIAIRLHSCGVPIPVEAFRCNSILLSRVFVGPEHLQPATRIWLVSGDKMKFFRVHT